MVTAPPPLHLPCFNSTMVRLKASTRRTNSHQAWSFNSTMVRLKGSKTFSSKISCPWFQFHNGSIKSRTGLTQTLKDRGFNSTMVRLKEDTRKRVWLSELRFNSTMVRLKEGRTERYRDLWCSFNSTMVRLKGDQFISPTTSDDKFQFHNGSIKRKTSPRITVCSF